MKFAALLLLLSCTAALAYLPCCPRDDIIGANRRCGNTTISPTYNLNCTLGHVVFKDVTVINDKVTSKNSPNFVFVDNAHQYCIGEMYYNNSDPGEGLSLVVIACWQESMKYNTDDIETSGVLTLISTVFLLATFAVYSYLPQLRDLQGLCYMCMCISMAIGFLSLGILQLSPGFKGDICTATGFLVYFWMIATFFWMNVICINVYRTVTDATLLKKTERKQYFLYSCYAWGATIVFFVVALITNFAEGDHWKPGFGSGSCWLNGRTEIWIFFYGPIAILIISNILLFIISSYKLWMYTRKYEVSKLNNLKYRFLLSLKLFLVMGISWVFEIASFAHGQSHIIWKITDTFNCLQGLVIFILLVVLRKRAMRGLAKAGFCLMITQRLAEKLSPHDESCDQQMLDEEHTEVRLN